MPAEKQRGFGHSRKRIALEIGALVGGLIAVVALAVWVASLLAAVLVAWIPVAADIAVGDTAWPELAPEHRHCDNAAPLAYVEQIAAPLVAALDSEDFEFRFAVLDGDEVNAFALPGGRVAVNAGLLRAAQSGDEVAAVIAHELVHVVERHGMVRVLRSAGGGAIIGLIVGWSDVGVLLSYAGDLADLAYDRAQERVADARGRELMMRVGLDPGALGRLFSRVSLGAAPPAFLSSHPDLVERIEAAEGDAESFTPTRRLPAPDSSLCCRAPCPRAR